MELRFERILPCTPDRAFALVSDPDRMNLWSTAAVRAIRPGDGGLPSGVGALREVRVSRGRVLEEVVEIADPPHRFGYRVIGGAPVRSHLGQIRLAPVEGGTHLDWHVDVAFPLPGMGVIARRQLEPALSASLDRLVDVALRATDGALPPVRDLYEDDVLPELYARAEAVLTEQRDLADELERARDPRSTLTRAYHLVSASWLQACRQGRFAHPGWVLRLIPAIHAGYGDALARWLHRAEGPVDSHWRDVFASEPSRRPAEAAARTLRRGMRVRVDEDLPRALVDIHADAYAGRCDYARFRADFLRTGALLRDALRRASSPTVRRAVLHRVLPAGVRETWLDGDLADLALRRRDAFERGERWSRWVEGRAAR